MVAYAILSGGPVPSGLMLEGAAHLAGVLHCAGYRPRVYDFNNFEAVDTIARIGKAAFLDQCVDYLHAEIARYQMKIIGFTLYTNGFYDCVQIAERLKARNRGLIIAAGGPLVGWFEEALLSFSDVFDILVRGEGDLAVLKLAEAVYDNGSLGEVPGAIYRSGSEIVKNPKVVTDISTLPLPLYDEEVYPAFNSKIKVATLRTSVGCTWGRCSYCVQPRLHGKYRERRIDDVLMETEALERQYGLKHFRLSDPSPKPARIREIAAGLSDEQRFACFLYPEPDLDLGAAAKKLLAIFLGLERSAADDLRAVNKCRVPALHAAQTALIVEQAKQLGIASIVANIVPVANDSVAAIQRHLHTVLKMNPDFVTITALFPIPGSPLYRQVLKEGDATGIRLDDGYLEKLTHWTIDLLKPASEWPTAPFQINVDGVFTSPLNVAATEFGLPLQDVGIETVSDDMVLMAYNHWGALSEAQNEKREQVSAFQRYIRRRMDRSAIEEREDEIRRYCTRGGNIDETPRTG